LNSNQTNNACLTANSRGLAQIALLKAVSKWVNHYERNDKRKDRASKEEKKKKEN
jgi:hypothetical protein